MSEESLREAASVYRSEFAPLIDQLYRERVIRARESSPAEKLLAGEELFAYASAITLAGIRHQNPGLSEEDCHRELGRRLALRDYLDTLKRGGQEEPPP